MIPRQKPAAALKHGVALAALALVLTGSAAFAATPANNASAPPAQMTPGAPGDSDNDAPPPPQQQAGDRDMFCRHDAAQRTNYRANGGDAVEQRYAAAYYACMGEASNDGPPPAYAQGYGAPGYGPGYGYGPYPYDGYYPYPYYYGGPYYGPAVSFGFGFGGGGWHGGGFRGGRR